MYTCWNTLWMYTGWNIQNIRRHSTERHSMFPIRCFALLDALGNLNRISVSFIAWKLSDVAVHQHSLVEVVDNWRLVISCICQVVLGSLFDTCKATGTHFSAVTTNVKGQCSVVPKRMPHIVVQPAFYHKNKECDPQWVLAKMKPSSCTFEQWLRIGFFQPPYRPIFIAFTASFSCPLVFLFSFMQPPPLQIQLFAEIQYIRSKTFCNTI
jgi:hypothetical protein